MVRSEPSVDEIVSSLKHAALPTVLVEGRDDMTIYRWIEERLGIQSASVLPCGGKGNLLAIFSRRNEFLHLKHAFLMDRDMEVFSLTERAATPIVLTQGYSIENDILDGSGVPKLLSKREAEEFDDVATSLSQWFAFEVEQYRAGNDWSVEIRLNKLVPLGSTQLSSTFFSRSNADLSLVQSIKENFLLWFRGKCLLELFVRFLSASSRESKHTKLSILEIGTKIHPSNHLRLLAASILDRLK